MDRDYRFDMLVHALRKQGRSRYAFSTEASRELANNDCMSKEYGEDMWDEFWEELQREFEERNLPGADNVPPGSEEKVNG